DPRARGVEQPDHRDPLGQRELAQPRDLEFTGHPHRAGHHGEVISGDRYEPAIDLSVAGDDAAADGVITGYGKVDGRLVAVAAYDFTVMAGSMGMTGELKVSRLRELALTKRIPMIWLLDSAGARV